MRTNVGPTVVKLKLYAIFEAPENPDHLARTKKFQKQQNWGSTVHLAGLVDLEKGPEFGDSDRIAVMYGGTRKSSFREIF